MVGDEFEDLPFADQHIHIPTVNPERTFLEKLFLLHEEFQKPNKRVDRLSRHLYDIHQIAQTEFAQKALNDEDLYQTIVEHRSVFSKIGAVDYTSHFPPSFNPIPPDELMKLWEQDYRTMQEQMIYGEPIHFDTLIKTLRRLTAQINNRQ